MTITDRNYETADLPYEITALPISRGELLAIWAEFSTKSDGDSIDYPFDFAQDVFSIDYWLFGRNFSTKSDGNSIDYFLMTNDYFLGNFSTKSDGDSIDYFLLTIGYLGGIYRPKAMVVGNKNKKV